MILLRRNSDCSAPLKKSMQVKQERALTAVIPGFIITVDVLFCSARGEVRRGFEKYCSAPRYVCMVLSVDTYSCATLKSFSRMIGANQIIQLAIETLRKELPIQPPSVNDLRRSESLSKQQLVSAARLETTRNRGKPFSEGSEKVGKIQQQKRNRYDGAFLVKKLQKQVTVNFW